MKFLKCTVIMVYTDRGVCDAISIDNLNFFQDISYTQLGINQSGDDKIPEINDVLVIQVDDDGSATLFKRYANRLISDSGLNVYSTGQDGNLGLPGDYRAFGPDGSALSLLSGMAAKLSATPLCQMVMLGIENLTRLITANQETITSGTRYTTISDNGNVLTRFVMSSSDVNFINSSDGQTSERYEFQFDFSSAGLNLLIGEIDPTSKKRINHFLININTKNDITFKLGKDLSNNKESAEYYFSFDGTFSHKVFDENGVTVYNRTIAQSNGRALVNEYINGNFTRHITGDMLSEIDGNIIETSHNKYETASALHQSNSTMNSQNSSINQSILSTAPQVSVQ